MKAESLGIPQKLQLKVDVESGKLIIKKSKDGSEDKFYSHKKSKVPRNALIVLVSAPTGDQPEAGGWRSESFQAYPTPVQDTCRPGPLPGRATSPAPPAGGPPAPVHPASFLQGLGKRDRSVMPSP